MDSKEAKKERSKFTNFIKNTLRRASYRWPGRDDALRLARVARGFYKCAQCGIDTFKRSDVEIDHTDPVVPIDTDWIKEDGEPDWNIYIKRLFVKADGFQILCKNCHSAKTQIEDEMRAFHNAQRKKEQKELDKKTKT